MVDTDPGRSGRGDYQDRKAGRGRRDASFRPAFSLRGGDATYFLAANRNKQSVTIDFSKPEGAALVKRLARRAHVVVENFKTGTLARYGLDYECLAAENPGLIYCSLTGFGHDGPYKDKAGYDYLIQGMGGLMSITGQPDGTPGAEPMKVGVAVSDLVTGLYTTIAIQAALIHQARTGEGQAIDMALFDCQAAALANQAMNYLAGGMVPGRSATPIPISCPIRCSRRDGYLILAVANDRQYRSFCRAAEREELGSDARFQTNASRVAHRETLVALLEPVFATRTTEEWITRLEAANVPCGPINRVDQVFADPQAIARGSTSPWTTNKRGRSILVASPLKLSRTPPEYRHAPPLLGEHTDEVLRGILDLSAPTSLTLRAQDYLKARVNG